MVIINNIGIPSFTNKNINCDLSFSYKIIGNYGKLQTKQLRTTWEPFHWENPIKRSLTTILVESVETFPSLCTNFYTARQLCSVVLSKTVN